MVDALEDCCLHQGLLLLDVEGRITCCLVYPAQYGQAARPNARAPDKGLDLDSGCHHTRHCALLPHHAHMSPCLPPTPHTLHLSRSLLLQVFGRGIRYW